MSRPANRQLYDSQVCSPATVAAAHQRQRTTQHGLYDFALSVSLSGPVSMEHVVRHGTLPRFRWSPEQTTGEVASQSFGATERFAEHAAIPRACHAQAMMHFMLHLPPQGAITDARSELRVVRVQRQAEQPWTVGLANHADLGNYHAAALH